MYKPKTNSKFVVFYMFFSFVPLILKYSIFTLFFLFFLSCSSNPKKVSRGSGNNFSAYYNTFYMAEKSYNDALDLIQAQSNTQTKNTTQINNLLDIAIKNSLIIENKFYNTKYIDDALYILGMSSYYKNRITAASYYLNKILNDYPNTEFYNKVNIKIGLLNLKVGKINTFKEILENIIVEKLNKEEKYEYYNLMAFYYDYYNDIENITNSYSNSLKYANTKVKRIYIYNKLLDISNKQQDYKSCIEFIEGIQDNSETLVVDKDLLKKWINYKLKLNHTKDVIYKIEDLLSGSVTKKDELFYKILLSRSYISLNDYDTSNNILNELLNENTSSSAFKNEFSEIYYLLAEINLLESLYENAQENYQLSIDVSRVSEYGKKSKNKIDALINYTNYIEEIKFLGFDGNNNINETAFIENKQLDSLFFFSGQLLYFDLDNKELAEENFLKIINNYPDSKYRYKSLLFLDIENPDSLWGQLLIKEFPESNMQSNIFELSEIDLLIDETWDMLEKKPKECIEGFVDIHEKYNNDKSLYIVGFIYDDYFKDIENSIKYYNKYINMYEEGEFYHIVKNRVNDIEEMYHFEIKSREQRMHFKNGFDFFKYSNNLDSSLFYLDLASKGENKKINSLSFSLIRKIKEYTDDTNSLKLNLENPDSIINDIDIVKFNIAEFLYKDFRIDSLSANYYLEIIKNESTYIKESYAALTYIDSVNSWDSLLYSLVLDSTKFFKLIENAKHNDHISLIESINVTDDTESYKWYSSSYNKLFPVHVEQHTDTMIVDTVINDSIEAKKANYNIDINSGKIIFDDSLKININIPENFKPKSEIIDTMIVDTVIKDSIESKKVNYDIDINSGKIIPDDSLKMNINIPESFKPKSEIIDTSVKNENSTE